MNQNIISAAIKYIEELFKENADGHDAAHTMRVYKNAERLAEYYPESDKEIIFLSALLHDVDDHKLFDTKNNENARR
ncbi:MAG: HD domain-containing protein, partial [Lachnospiraceae bacterium]|nr:HD domain-containing protein [Lachnospiraceae bacterium]